MSLAIVNCRSSNNKTNEFTVFWSTATKNVAFGTESSFEEAVPNVAMSLSEYTVCRRGRHDHRGVFLLVHDSFPSSPIDSVSSTAE